MAAVCFTACCIRIGNFFNSEIIGKPSNLPWAVIFQQVDSVPRHPAMLYESLVYLTLFVVLQLRYLRYGKNINAYMQMGIAFTGIFTGRFFLELVKENQVSFENGMLLNMGQLLSIPFILIGISMMTGHYEKWLNKLSHAYHAAENGNRPKATSPAKPKKGAKKTGRR